MKSKKQFTIIIILLLTLSILTFYTSITATSFKDTTNTLNSPSLKTSTTYTNQIIIEDDNPLLNWANRSAMGICTGSGTSGDPYVINNDIINTTDNYGIFIRDSRKYFKITNCKIIAANVYGIALSPRKVH